MKALFHAHTMQQCGGGVVWTYLFFTFALDNGEWLTSRPSRFALWARARIPIEKKFEWAPELI